MLGREARLAQLEKELSQLGQAPGYKTGDVSGVRERQDRQLAAWHAKNDREVEQLRQRLASPECNGATPARSISNPTAIDKETDNILEVLVSQMSPAQRQAFQARYVEESQTKALGDDFPTRQTAPSLLREDTRASTRVLQMPSVGIATDERKSEKDLRLVEALCAAFGGNVPKLPNGSDIACPFTRERRVRTDEIGGGTPPPSPTLRSDTSSERAKPLAKPSKEFVKVPNVKGQARDKAFHKLDELGFVVDIKEEAECNPSEKVVSQEPKKDSLLPVGGMVTITVSSAGLDAVKVPSLMGRSHEDAEREIQQLGLRIKYQQSRETDEYPPDTVLKQKPEPSTRMKLGCQVAITLSAAIPDVIVPDFVGLTEAEVQRRIGNGNLRPMGDQVLLGTITYSDLDAPPDTVISQDPKAGTLVKRDTEVNFVIARHTENRVEPMPRPGPEEPLFEVPDLTGRERRRVFGKDEAIQVLQSLGFDYEIVTDGQVVESQDPPAHARRRRGTRVRLWLRNIE